MINEAVSKWKIPKASVLALREGGYDVLSIGEDNPSIQDHEVIDIAIKEGRLILTFDRDYGELVFLRGLRPPKGIIYLRIDPFLSWRTSWNNWPIAKISKIRLRQRF